MSNLSAFNFFPLQTHETCEPEISRFETRDRTRLVSRSGSSHFRCCISWLILRSVPWDCAYRCINSLHSKRSDGSIQVEYLVNACQIASGICTCPKLPRNSDVIVSPFEDRIRFDCILTLNTCSELFG